MDSCIGSIIVVEEACVGMIGVIPRLCLGETGSICRLVRGVQSPSIGRQKRTELRQRQGQGAALVWAGSHSTRV